MSTDLSDRNSTSGLAQVTPLVRDTLHEQAYAKLRHLLMTGAVRPGTELSLRSVAHQLAISEMPVREAVRRLIAEKALRSLPSRKVIVPHTDAREFRELLAIRTLLEGEAVRLASDLLTKADLQDLIDLQARMTAIGPDDDGAYLTLNQAFHFTIYRACGFPLMTAMIETLWLRIGPIFTHIPVRMARKRATNCHQLAIDALARGDGAAASLAIKADLAAVGTTILTILESKPSPASDGS